MNRRDEAQEDVRVRMAPSPTGPIHIGNVHTTLFNWLFARQRGGRFVLRFEDTDAARSDRRWEQVIYDELRWLGLDWDEAPDCGGPYGPYRQTERLGLYLHYAQLLLKAGAAYECYCTAEELDAERKAAQAEGNRPYQYSRRCRHLTPEQRQAFLAEGRTPAIRFAIPDNQVVVVEDLIRGRIEFQTSALGDPVIVRRNGMPLYNFAVVVDDLTMHVTHVLRGEGHISNTPLQVLIYRALGESAPVFGHFGHITGGDGAKFSKRRGEGYIGYYREQGVLPEAMFNYLALLGWTPKEREILTRAEILKEFDIGRVTPSPSQFDPVKLRWFSGHHIRRLQTAEVAGRCLPYLIQAGLLPEAPDDDEMARVEGVVALAQTRIETLGEIVELTGYFFCDELSYTPQAVKMIARPGVREMLELALERLSAAPEWTVGSLESTGAQLLADLDCKPAAVYQPIRAAVTGRTASPPLFDTLYWIGRKRTLSRLERAVGGDLAAAAAPARGGTSPQV